MLFSAVHIMKLNLFHTIKRAQGKKKRNANNAEERIQRGEEWPFRSVGWKELGAAWKPAPDFTTVLEKQQKWCGWTSLGPQVCRYLHSSAWPPQLHNPEPVPPSLSEHPSTSASPHSFHPIPLIWNDHWVLNIYFTLQNSCCLSPPLVPF